MASVSVVGQHPGPHRLDSENQVLLLKLTSSRKRITLLRKTSWEKMLSRRGAPVPGEREPGAHPSAGETAPGGGGVEMPGDGCECPTAPRSPERGAEAGKTDTGTRESDLDSNRNSGGRRGTSLKRVNGTRSGPVTHSHRHRDTSRRDTGRQGTPCALVPPPHAGSFQERLTQGRTGVVRLARTEPHRREAWSIFPRGGSEEEDPRVRTERGEGHRFQGEPVTQDWCDSCSRQITAQALKCRNCSYTCHLECESQVQVDCNKRDREPDETSPRGHCSSTVRQQRQNESKEEEEGRTKELSEEEVRTRIEEYNAQVSENGMNLASDGSFTGFIKVHLRLSRPVTVPSVDPAGSEGVPKQTGGGCDQTASEHQETAKDCEKRTSFYLPCDCVKQLHIGSFTTTREVIQGLLKKFMVLDNPRKFALYRQTHRDGQDLFQKLPLCERPLLLRLIAGPDPDQLSFVLKENETGEVEWHAFSVPELQNFLVILEKEEAERVRAVEQKYTVYRQRLQQALRQHDP